MPKQVTVPGVGLVSFPDEMDDAAVVAAIERDILPQAKKLQEPAASPAGAPPLVDRPQSTSPPAPLGGFGTGEQEEGVLANLRAGFARAAPAMVKNVGGFVQAASELPLRAAQVISPGFVPKDYSPTNPILEAGRAMEPGTSPGIGLEQVVEGKASVPEMAASMVGENLPQLGAAVLTGMAGGPAASAGMSFMQNAGDTYLNSVEKGDPRPVAALLAGIPMAALDLITPMRLLGKIGWKVAADAPPASKGLLREIFKTTVGEAGTEAAQEAVGAAVEPGTFFSPETAWRVANAFVGGGLVGGLAGGAVEAATGKSGDVPSGSSVPTQPTPIVGQAGASNGASGAVAPPPIALVDPAVEETVALTTMPQPAAVPVPEVSSSPDGSRVRTTFETPAVDDSWKAPDATRYAPADYSFEEASGTFASTVDPTYTVKGDEAAGFTVTAPLREGQDGQPLLTSLGPFPSVAVAQAVASYALQVKGSVRQLRGKSPEQLANLAFEFGRISPRTEMQTPSGPVAFVDDTKSLTHKDFHALQSNPRYTALIGRLRDYTSQIAMAARGAGLEQFADVITVGKTSAAGRSVFGYFDPLTRRLAINPLTNVRRYTPIQASQEVMNTVLHELAHGAEHNHNLPFIQAVDRLNTFVADLAGSDLFGQMRSDLAHVFASPSNPRQLHPNIVEAINTIEGSRGRSSGANNALGAAGSSRSAFAEGDESSIEGRLPRDLEETLGVGPVWYSRAERVIRSLTGERVAAHSVLNVLRKYGVKDEEIKWSGLKVWLEEKKGQVGKQELLDYLGENGVRVEEILYDKEAGPGEAVAYDTGELPYSEYQVPGGSNYRALLLTLPGDKLYQSPHWEEQNVLVHVRFNERLDINGRKTLFIEEIQSDWFQKGREEGFRDDNNYGTLVLPPLAPFSETYHQLALKRMIRWAAENGFEQLAWTSGRTQVERYATAYRAVVQKIVVGHPTERFYSVQVTSDGNAYVYFFENNKAQGQSEIAGKSMEEIFGAAVAARIQAAPVNPYTGDNPGEDPPLTLTGPDLTIGGEGMKHFYDKVLPGFAERYGKQWGARLERPKIQTDLKAGNSTFTPIYTEMWGLSITEPMRRSVLNDGQPLFRDLPPEGQKATETVALAVSNLNEGVPADAGPISRAAGDNIQRGIEAFTLRQKHITTLKQLLNEFPGFQPLRNFALAIQKMQTTAGAIKLEGGELLKNWAKLGVTRATAVGKAHFEVSVQSHEKARKLNATEEQAILQNFGFDASMLEVYAANNGFLQKQLARIHDTLIEEARRTLGDQSLEFLAEESVLLADFAKISNRNYFPFTRFGKFAILVHANSAVTIDGKNYKKGELIALETWESEKEQQQRQADVRQQFAGHDVQVSLDLLPDSLQQLYGLPPALVTRMIKHLQLSSEQIQLASDFAYSLTPNRSFLKHMMQRRGIAGFSADAQRVFATYTQSVANQIARVENRLDLQEAIQQVRASATAMRAEGSAVPTRKLAERLDEIYKERMNPGLDYAQARGLLFAWNFMMVPKQVLVNLLQLPAFSWQHLANRSDLAGASSLEAAKELAVALRDVTQRYFTQIYKGNSYQGNISQTELDAFDAAEPLGTFQQGISTELAALAHGSPLHSLLGGRAFGTISKEHARKLDSFLQQGVNAGLWMFKTSEELNRRTTFLAATRMATKRGIQMEALVTLAANSVDNTQFDYSAFNRIRLATGKPGEPSIRPLLFLYKSYLQHALYFYAKHEGGRQALLVHLALAGVAGLPFAENIFDLIDLLGTWFKDFFGMKNPRVDAKKEVRDLFNSIGLGDLAMHGLTRRFLGLFDLQGSISLGDILPTDPIKRGLLHEIKPETAVFRALQEVSGAAGSQGLNFSKALFDLDTGTSDVWRTLVPNELRNLHVAQQAVVNKGWTTTAGKPLVPLDMSDPTHVAEVLGQLMGMRPTRVAEKQELKFSADEVGTYYSIRRNLVLQDLGVAYASKEQEPRNAAKEALREFNRIAPRAFSITGEQAIASVRERLENRSFAAKGLPTQERWAELYKEYERVYAPK